MDGNKMKCVFCKRLEDKIILFEDVKLKKCQEVLRIRVKYNLKYNDIELPTEINKTDGYHRQCYSSFTALMAKYRHSSSEIDCTSKSTSDTLSANTSINISETTSKNTNEKLDSEIVREVASSSLIDHTTSNDLELTSNKEIIPEDVTSNLNNQCVSEHLELRVNSEVLSEDAASSLDSQTIVGNIASSSTCNLSINESNVCDNTTDANIENLETGRQLKNVCFYCNKDRKQNKGKQQTLHSSNDIKLYEKIIEWLKKLDNEELLQRINDLKSANKTIFYHHLCELNYLNEYNRVVSDIPCTSWHKNRHIHKEVFNSIVSTIEEVLKKRNCVSLSSLCDTYNYELEYEQRLQPDTDISLITNYYLEEKIQKYFKKSIRIIPRQKKKYYS